MSAVAHIQAVDVPVTAEGEERIDAAEADRRRATPTPLRSATFLAAASRLTTAALGAAPTITAALRRRLTEHRRAFARLADGAGVSDTAAATRLP